MFKVYTLALSSLSINSVLSHSWVECISKAENSGTDIPDNAGHPDFIKNCIGFPRAFPGRVAGSNIDGYTYQISDNKPSNLACNNPSTTISSYSNNYPMTEVPAGTPLKIWYSMNGHRNEYKHDVGLYSYEVSGKQFYYDNEIKSELSLGNYPFATGDNCFDMNNHDNTMCWNEWTIPSNWSTGVYSFVWKWKFNSYGTHEEYNTCFEIKVTSKVQNLPVVSNVNGGYRNSQVDPVVYSDQTNLQVSRVMDFENHSLPVDPAANFDGQNSRFKPVVKFDGQNSQVSPAIDFENHSIPAFRTSDLSNVRKAPLYSIPLQNDFKPRRFYQSSASYPSSHSPSRSYFRDPNFSNQQPGF